MTQLDWTPEFRAQLLSELLDARLEHMNWLRNALESENPDAPIDPHACKFGRWMRQIDDALGTVPEFQALEEPHDRLHASYRAWRASPDQDDLRRDLQRRSSELIDAIDSLESMLRQHR